MRSRTATKEWQHAAKDSQPGSPPLPERDLRRPRLVLALAPSLHLPSLPPFLPASSPPARAPHRDHLREATGLKHGGDEDEVAGRVDEVAQRLVEGEAKGGVLAAVAVLQTLELRLARRGRGG